MWYATQDFYFRGKLWKKGDEVPAQAWPGRTALVRLRRIKFVSPTVVDPEPIDITKLKREDLNAHALNLGIENPAGLPNKDAVIAAIQDLDNPVSVTNPVNNAVGDPVGPVTEEELQESTAGTETEKEAPAVVADDLFADPGAKV